MPAQARTYPEMADYAETCRRFAWHLPRTFNFGADVVDRWAEDPSMPALVWCNEAGAEERFTFADIARLSNRFANVLADQGIGKGDRIVVMLPRVPQWQITMVACLKLGAVAVPCIDMLTRHDLEYRITHSGARGVVTTVAGIEKVPPDVPLAAKVSLGGGEGWTDWHEAVEAAPDAFVPARVGLEDPAVIYYTSGTTGSPKGVTHGARALYAWRATAQYWLDLAPNDLMWCTADTGWSKAGTSILFGPWSQGAAVLFYDGPFDPKRRLELLERYRVTVFCAAATELRRLVFEDVGSCDLSALRHTVSAGESLNPEVAGRWTELTGRPTREGYGQTETLMSIHTYPGVPGKTGSMGLPLPGYQVAVLDPEGAPLPEGEPGILAIRLPNPNVMLGYWREPERMAAQIVRNGDGEWWLTGDTAHIDAEGYVYFHGRSDDVINSAGYRIGPSEVENALLQHPAVRECAAVASPDEGRGAVVKAFIVLADGYEGSDALARAIQEHCKRETAPYKYPRRLAFVRDLPKNVAGKILRGELRRREFAEAAQV